jgi:hypothetical protein
MAPRASFLFHIYKSSALLIALANETFLYIISTIIISHVHVYFAVLFSEKRLNSITDERGIRLLLLNICNVHLCKIASCF